MSTNDEGQSVSPNDAKPNVRRSLLSYMVEMHKFFVKESKTYVGVQKENKSKSYPIWGENKWWRKFDPNEHEMYKYTIVDIGYEKYWSYKFKDLLYFPIAYCKFMWYSFKDWRASQNYA